MYWLKSKGGGIGGSTGWLYILITIVRGGGRHGLGMVINIGNNIKGRGVRGWHGLGMVLQTWPKTSRKILSHLPT